MNPKDMTNEQVIIGLSDALRVEINHLNKPDDRIYGLNYRQTMESELLRRLVEADALRKENEELRNLLGECPKRNNRLGTYSDAKPVQIDVCKLICMTKEREASHG